MELMLDRPSSTWRSSCLRSIPLNETRDEGGDGILTREQYKNDDNHDDDDAKKECKEPTELEKQ